VCVCVVVHRDVTGVILVASLLSICGFASTALVFSLAVEKHCLTIVPFMPMYDDILLAYCSRSQV